MVEGLYLLLRPLHAPAREDKFTGINAEMHGTGTHMWIPENTTIHHIRLTYTLCFEDLGRKVESRKKDTTTRV